jgi:hypothetical protein
MAHSAQPAPLTPEINLSQMTDGLTSFNSHYSVLGIQGFAPDLCVLWTDFVDVVENQGGISPVNEIVLKFIHRFDGTNWFLTMEVDQCDFSTGQIIAIGKRFDITANGISASNFQGNFDPAYFASVLFNGAQIDPATYINSTTFPYYQQIKEMNCQNRLPNDNTIFIKFSSVTYDYSAQPKLSLVAYPHMVLPYMNSSVYGDYVNDTVYTSMFENKAADCASMCPPCCNGYDWPSKLPIQTICLPS